MNITIYTIAKQFNPYYLEAVGEYAKRLSRYSKTNLVLLSKEAALRPTLLKKCYSIGLIQSSDCISSEALANKLTNFALHGRSNLLFLNHFTETETDETMSLSQMDLHPQLLTVVLYEQLYRSFRIIHNEPYHK